MRAQIVAFAAGLIFAAGLALAGMTQPGKVIGFLDFTGRWDPSLAFVMGGAVLTTAVLFRLAWRRPKPVFAQRFQLPVKITLDGRLIGGAALFGVGWGLAGYCPGPAIASVGTGAASVGVFMIAMIVGMYGFKLMEGVLAKAKEKATEKRKAGSSDISARSAAREG